MASSIIDDIQGELTNDVIESSATRTGEPPERTRSAWPTAILATVAGLVRRGSTRAGAESLLFNLRGEASTSLVGEHADELMKVVATSSGVGPNAARTMMGTIAPLAARVLATRVRSRSLDAAGLQALLLEEKRELLGDRRLPADLATWLGGGARLGSASFAATPFAADQRDVGRERPVLAGPGFVEPRAYAP